MAKKVFITATGTDIGKTYISGLIVKKMREFGYNCGYFKPVLSGAYKAGSKLIPGDCEHVVNVANLSIEPLSCLSYCFEEAVSPHLASARLNIEINKEKIINDYIKLSEKYDYMLIEGAGGITCPITINDSAVYLMSDLIKDMNSNILIVADGGLGTINSVLTTVEYAQNRNINIKGLILNNFISSDFMYRDNLKMAERLTGLPVVSTVEKNDKDINIQKAELEGIFE